MKITVTVETTKCPRCGTGKYTKEVADMTEAATFFDTLARLSDAETLCDACQRAWVGARKKILSDAFTSFCMEGKK